MTSECEVCITQFEPAIIIECPYCKYKSCLTCTKTYLLTSIDTKCMKCNSSWSTLEIILNKFTSSFQKELVNKQRDLILEREKLLLPETVDYAKCVKEFEKLKKEKHEEVLRIRELKKKKAKVLLELKESRTLVLLEQSLDIDDEIDQAKIHIQALNKQVSGGTKYTSSAEYGVYFYCPSEDCKGFLIVEDKALQCQLCNTNVCGKCRECITSSKHKCNPETIKSLNKLEKDSKSCPGCKRMIYRISGCPQMFCTQCHTVFNFNTGKIEKGPIHNPHYVDYLLQNRQEVQDNAVYECDENGILTFDYLNQFLSKNKKLKTTYQHFIMNMTRAIIHFQTITIPDQQMILDTTIPNKYKDCRVRYLLNKLTIRGWKGQITSLARQQALVQDRIDILRTVIDTGISYQQAFIQKADVCQILFEWNKFIDYINSVFKKSSIKYDKHVHWEIDHKSYDVYTHKERMPRKRL